MDRYRIQRLTASGEPAGTATADGSADSYVDTGLTPGTAYHYRIRTANAAGKSEWSQSVAVTTLPTKVFEQRSYTFSVYGASFVGTSLGTVSGPADTDSSITYNIGGGSEQFAINSNTGLLSTTDALLDYDTVSSYQFTVSAWDDGAEQDRATVAISVVAPCTDGITITDRENKPKRVADCKVLLSVRDALRGTGTLNWFGGLNMGHWDGVELLADEGGVDTLVLSESR